MKSEEIKEKNYVFFFHFTIILLTFAVINYTKNMRHEQAAGHMADASSRVTGKTGVVLVTSGPGATNTVTPIATAYMDSIPMVILSGQVASHLIGEDAFQETDMVGISRPIVKHSFQVRHASEIPSIIKKAFYIASSGRPGPVVVDIPKDATNPAEKFAYEYPEKVKMRSYQPPHRGYKAGGQWQEARQPCVAQDLRLQHHEGQSFGRRFVGIEGLEAATRRHCFRCWY